MIESGFAGGAHSRASVNSLALDTFIFPRDANGIIFFPFNAKRAARFSSDSPNLF